MMRGEEREIVEDSFDKIEEQYLEKNLYYLWESEKNRNLLKKKIITNKCFLREKDNILNLSERESVWKNKNILVD